MEISYQSDKMGNQAIPNSSERKSDHINLALQSQTLINESDQRFYYEPMISGFPVKTIKQIALIPKEYCA